MTKQTYNDGHSTDLPQGRSGEHFSAGGSQGYGNDPVTPQYQIDYARSAGAAVQDAPFKHGENQSEAPPKFIKPRRKRSRFVMLMQFMMSLAFFVAIGLAGFFMFTRYQIDKPGPLQAAMVFEVEKGQGLSTISARLEKGGIIADRRMFAMHAVTSNASKKLKAGKFSIPENASMQKVLDILVKGRAIYYQVTVPEGKTSEQIVAILNAHPQLTGTIGDIPREGHLMPNTFQFSEGAKRQGILEKMLLGQEAILNELWPGRQKDLPFKTAEEALIMASIVEKETGQSSERARVAGVFVNRLRRGMKLQSDPTIIYGLVGGKGSLGHPLRRSEMNKKTNYNTYQISGLPPTPIANPGRKSIEAVLQPAKTDDLFFVADGTGGHAFAPTLKKHNQNVAKWRKIEAKRRAEAKRREAEQKRLALQAEKAEKVTKPEEKLPGVTIVKKEGQQVQDLLMGAKNSSIEKAENSETSDVWSNIVPLPVRKPR